MDLLSVSYLTPLLTSFVSLLEFDNMGFLFCLEELDIYCIYTDGFQGAEIKIYLGCKKGWIAFKEEKRKKQPLVVLLSCPRI